MGARSVGHYRVPAGWRDIVAVKHFVQLFWGVAGQGAIVIRDREQILEPGMVAVYFPGMKHIITAMGDSPWEYRWWTLDGPQAADIASGFGLMPGIHKAGPAPVKLFSRLERAVRDISPSGERQAVCMAFELMSKVAVAGLAHREDDELVKRTLEILRSKWMNYPLSVKTMAAELGVDRTVLTRRFIAAVGMAPKEYLSGLRIQAALSLLKKTRLPMPELAMKCGIKDPNYFSRLLSRRLGVSPLRFRKR